MFKDCRGLPLTTPSDKARRVLITRFDGYLGLSRQPPPIGWRPCWQADPACGLAHCLKGYLLLMSFRADLLEPARAALAQARRYPGTAREIAHAEALSRWIDGDPGSGPWRCGTRSWRIIRTISVAFRLAHFLNSGVAGRRRCWAQSERSSGTGAAGCRDLVRCWLAVLRA